MTADTTRSNVLYLFQAEGAKELGTHINASLVVEDLQNVSLEKSQKQSMKKSTKDLEGLLDGDASLNQTGKKKQQLENEDFT